MLQPLPGHEGYKGYKDLQGDYIILHDQTNKIITDCGACPEKDTKKDLF